MKMKRSKKLVGIFVMLLILYCVAPVVAADSSDVTTRWIVPADTTIAISYPNSETLIEFSASAQNFSDLKATAQTETLAALRVTNNGNTAVQLEAEWTDDFPSGVTDVNVSVGDDSNDTWFWYTSDNETTNQTWVASLAVDAAEDFWFWSSGTEVEETAGVDKTLRIWSTNV